MVDVYFIMFTPTLLDHIYKSIELLPNNNLLVIIDILYFNNDRNFESIVNQIMATLPNLKFRRTVNNLLNQWHLESHNQNYSDLAIALESMAYSVNKINQSQQIELVWTAPENSGLPVRQTAQVLLELINNTKKNLIIISFAVYKIPEIQSALMEALKRGINLTLIVETPESGEGKIPFGIKNALNSQILNQAQIYIWSKSQRPVNSQGNYGSLHIKAVISDQKVLFISSANLTEYALNFNLEMGVIIKDTTLASQIINQLKQLILYKILTIYEIKT